MVSKLLKLLVRDLVPERKVVGLLQGIREMSNLLVVQGVSICPKSLLQGAVLVKLYLIKRKLSISRLYLKIKSRKKEKVLHPGDKQQHH